jgi:tellurite methyltransferase
MLDLAAEFGQIDIYLFDQLLRGRIVPPARVFDAGCGAGRNLVYLLRAGCEVFGVDAAPEPVARVRDLAARLAPALPASNFRVEPLERTSFPDGLADVVISSAVLHFARDHDHFAAMLRETWRILGPGGLFFCRLASSIGMADRMQALGGGRYRMPDGTDRFLVDEAELMQWTAALGGTLLDPLKTTIVQDQRCMTTWVMRKPDARPARRPPGSERAAAG